MSQFPKKYLSFKFSDENILSISLLCPAYKIPLDLINLNIIWRGKK
jgi:hypothetical protein